MSPETRPAEPSAVITASPGQEAQDELRLRPNLIAEALEKAGPARNAVDPDFSARKPWRPPVSNPRR